MYRIYSSLKPHFLADLILPGASFAEKDGTFANADRRVQRVRQVIRPIGDSKPDWQIIAELAEKMCMKGFDYSKSEEIAKEIAALTPIYGGMLYNHLEEKGLQWPCLSNEKDEGTPILHQDKFSTENGKGKFIPLNYRLPAELTR